MNTGFDSIDRALDGGFLRKELIVIGADTGIGKSYLASQLMMNIAKRGFKCAYFSLEISNEMTVSRMLGALANIKPTLIQTGKLTKEEFEERAKAKAILEVSGDFMSFYDDVYELTELIAEIKSKEYEFVVIDFIQNIYSKEQDEYSRLNRISLDLQRTAKEANCAILLLSQVSNSAAKEGAKGKNLEYKGSGSIAIRCDLGFFLERGEMEAARSVQTVNLALKKNRRGSSGMNFSLLFKIPGGFLHDFN